MDPGRPWESVRDELLGTIGGSRTLALNVFYFVTTLLSPAAVPAGGMGWRLMFSGRGHVRNRCPRSHLEQKKRAVQALYPQGRQGETHIQRLLR